MTPLRRAGRGAGPSGLALALAALASLFLNACPRPPAPALADAGSRSPNRLGVRVPLPDGWTATVTPEGSLRAGPEDRPLVRIDRQPGAAGELPTAEVLKAAFASGLRAYSIRSEEVQRSENFVGLKLTLARGQADSGTALTQVALGAKRAGPDLFLCSTSPGTSAADISAALASCAEIGIAASDSP